MVPWEVFFPSLVAEIIQGSLISLALSRAHVSTNKSRITVKHGRGSILKFNFPILGEYIESKHIVPGSISRPFIEIAVLGSSATPSLKVKVPSCVLLIDLRTSRTDIFPGKEHNQVSLPVEFI